MTNKRYNSRGVEVCPEHGVPMYGFMSDAAKAVGENGKAITGELGSPDIKDIRDNRDPEEVGQEVLAEKAAQKNGARALEGLTTSPPPREVGP